MYIDIHLKCVYWKGLKLFCVMQVTMDSQLFIRHLTSYRRCPIGCNSKLQFCVYFFEIETFFVVRNFHFSCTKEQLDCENSKKNFLAIVNGAIFPWHFHFFFRTMSFFATQHWCMCSAKKFVRMLSGIFISLFNMTSCLQAD